MGELYVYKNMVTNIFQLIGTHENDITKSIAWTFAQCPQFSKLVFDEILEIDCNAQNIKIEYQLWDKDHGITDLEITDGETFYAIVEAKRGWNLPTYEQLEKYSTRSEMNSFEKRAIITMSGCSDEYAKENLPAKEINRIPIKHLSWKRLREIAKIASTSSTHSQNRLLNDLKEYLGGIMSMQQETSNMVYVVSLSSNKAENSEYSYIDIVEKFGKYYHPFGINGWPKEAANYVAFRYYGKLQSIHHVEKHEITKNVHSVIKEMPDKEWNTAHFVYTLGPAIRPDKEVKTGKIYASGRKWAMLDLLLTSDSIEEACEKTKIRLQKNNL